MGSEHGFVEYICEQMQGAGEISSRKMFGEYAVYCNAKVVALVCDDHLFVKPTQGGRQFIGNVIEAPPYPNAKLYFLIEDKFEDRDWISKLIQITARELPEPTLKKKKKG